MGPLPSGALFRLSIDTPQRRRAAFVSSRPCRRRERGARPPDVGSGNESAAKLRLTPTTSQKQYKRYPKEESSNQVPLFFIDRAYVRRSRRQSHLASAKTLARLPL